MSHFNIRLKTLRRNRNLSQEELARQLGVSRQAIIALEQGSSLPSLPVIMALLRVLDVPFPDLFSNHWSPIRHLDTNSPAETSNNLSFADCRYTSIRMTVAEDQQTLYLTAELAGVKEEDLTVDIGTQHVLISAVRKPRLSEEDVTIHTDEIDYGPLLRIVSLPAPIDTQSAIAEFNRGTLSLTLPKFTPEIKRRITFKKPTPIKNNDLKGELYGSE